MTDLLRQLLTGLRALVVFTVVLGVAYPVAVWGIGQLAFAHRAEGSLIVRVGPGGERVVVGSSLIGQSQTGPGWFASRPSASDYDPQASGGSNLGPSEPALLASIAERRAGVARRDGVAATQVPPDAVTASASGLDPYISPDYARIQVARVARARGLAVDQLQALVDEHTSGRVLGFLGEPRVNVLELNLSLPELSRPAAR